MYMNESEMTILETQIIQRDYDKRWEKVVKVLDKENSYEYTNEAGVRMCLTPEKWITTQVYDFIMAEVG